MAGQSLFLSLLACAALSLVRAQTSWTVGQPVNTTSGILTGTHGINHTDVSLYAGIPFAKPPVGELRWASPQPYRNTSAYNATSLPAGCAANSLASGGAVAALGAAGSSLAGQSAVNNLLAIGGIGGAVSEDCLYLNVWTKPQTGEAKKAVLIWFYGGGFQFGTSASRTYNGEHFANDQDVVLVTVNYRTNVFGFPGLPGVSSAAQNPGLEDQRLAVEWVRDNIEAFHGDADRITLFGESAGSASIDFYTYAYVDDPIIAGSIGTSGTSRSFFDPVKQNNTADWYKMSEALECGGNTTTAEDSIACLRTKTTEQVLNVTNIYNPLLSILGVFQPTSDEKVVFSDYPARGKAGKFIKKPFVTGNNNYEAGIFKFLAYNVTPPISDNSWDVFNLLVFTCPSLDAARVRYDAGSPVWRFRYFGEFSNMRLITAPNSGAYHVSEVPLVFKTTVETSGAPDTGNETIIAEYINTLYADFAKDPEGAMASRNLPQWNPTTESLIYFGVNNETEPWVVYTNNTDESCDPVVEAISYLGGTNALLGDPEGFNAQYGGIASSLTGFVGIGDSDHPDKPFGPPPIANTSAIPTSTPSVPGASTSGTGVSSGTAPTGTGVIPPTNSTTNSTRPPFSTDTVVPPKNSSRPIGTGTGSFVTYTRPGTSGSVPTAPGSGGYSSSPVGGGQPPVSSGGASPPASSQAPPPPTYGGGAPPPASSPAASQPVPSGGASVPPVSLPSPLPPSSVPPVSLPSPLPPVSSPAGSPPVSGSVPPPSANASVPIGTGTGTISVPIGTGTGTISIPIVTGTGASSYPSNSANVTVVDPIPATSLAPNPTAPTGTAPVPTYGGPAPSASSANPTSPGGYGDLEDILKGLDAEAKKQFKEAKALFDKLTKESQRKKRVAAWAANPERHLRDVAPQV